MKLIILGILLVINCARADLTWETHFTQVNQAYDALIDKTGARQADIIDRVNSAFTEEKLENILRDTPVMDLVSTCTVIKNSSALDGLMEPFELFSLVDRVPNIINCLLIPDAGFFNGPRQMHAVIAMSYNHPKANQVIRDKAMLDIDFSNPESLGWALAGNDDSFMRDLYSGKILLSPEKRILPKINLTLVNHYITLLALTDAEKSLGWLVEMGIDMNLILWKYSTIAKSPRISKFLKDLNVKVEASEYDIKDIINQKNQSFYYLVSEYEKAGNLMHRVLPTSFHFETLSDKDLILYDVLAKYPHISPTVEDSLKHKIAYLKQNENFTYLDFATLAWDAYKQCDLTSLTYIEQKYRTLPKPYNDRYHTEGCRDASIDDLHTLARWTEGKRLPPHPGLFMEAFRRDDKELLSILGAPSEEVQDHLYVESSLTNDIDTTQRLVDSKVPISLQGCLRSIIYALPEIQEMLGPLCGAEIFHKVVPEWLSHPTTKSGYNGLESLDLKKEIWAPVATEDLLVRLRMKEMWVLALATHRKLKKPLSYGLKMFLIKSNQACLVLKMFEEGLITLLERWEVGKVSVSNQWQCWVRVLKANGARGGLVNVHFNLSSLYCVEKVSFSRIYHCLHLLPEQNMIEKLIMEKKDYDLFRFWVKEVGRELDYNVVNIKEISPIPIVQFHMLVLKNSSPREAEDEQQIAIKVFEEFKDKYDLINVGFLEYLAVHNFFTLFQIAFEPQPSVIPSQVALYHICSHGNLDWIKKIYETTGILPDKRAKEHAATKGKFSLLLYIHQIEGNLNLDGDEKVVKDTYEESKLPPSGRPASRDIRKFIESTRNVSTVGDQSSLGTTKEPITIFI